MKSSGKNLWPSLAGYKGPCSCSLGGLYFVRLQLHVHACRYKRRIKGWTVPYVTLESSSLAAFLPAAELFLHALVSLFTHGMVLVEARRSGVK